MEFASFLIAVALFPASGLLVASADLPEGCREESGGYVCEFRTSTQEGAEALLADSEALGRVWFPVIAFERNIVTLTLRLEGINRGWFVFLDNDVDEGTSGSLLARNAPPSDDPAKREHLDTSTHYIEVDVSREVSIVFWAYGGYEKTSVGDFELTYAVTPARTGTPPARPAAAADDPHLRDEVGDVAPGWLDIEAFWFDDAAVGDGLIDAHMKVADLASLPSEPAREEGAYFWDVDFSVQGTRYALRWNRGIECTVNATRGDCFPYSSTTRPGGWNCVVGRRDVAAFGVALTQPSCRFDVENSTFHAVFPGSTLSAPGEGATFVDMRAESGVVFRPFTSREQGGSDGFRLEDGTTAERFPFALGGPEAWCEHRAASCVPALAWYRAPLAPENVPNTLQVIGALIAVGAFLGGLVRRRRARVHRLLREVEAVVDAYGPDAARGLLALGDLEDSLDKRLRKGAITDAEYQIVSQRIATAATRLAMRRDLGLDDGAPDATHVRP